MNGLNAETLESRLLRRLLFHRRKRLSKFFTAAGLQERGQRFEA